jgi:1,4-dihydroxy-2-naphthoate octaprenyltransferase
VRSALAVPALTVATGREWIAGARPRTLPAAIVPVVVGVAVVKATGAVSWWRAGLALVVSLAIQVGTNYANDYSDGVRGTDRDRVGPLRLTATGLATPHAVRNAAFTSFGLAAVAGLVVALSTSPFVLVAGAAAIAAGWFYTGGRHPYGYAGYGELFVFVFFGLVAVIGTVYVAGRHIPAIAWYAAVPVGANTVALLVVNNLRDIPTDAATGKRTLAVRVGAPATRWFYVSLLVVAQLFVILVERYRHHALLGLVAIVPAVAPVRRVLSRAEGRDLVPALGMTGMVQLIFGAALAAGIIW